MSSRINQKLNTVYRTLFQKISPRFWRFPELVRGSSCPRMPAVVMPRHVSLLKNYD